MKKMNNKGLTIIEIVITFSMIMFFAIGLLFIVVSYRNKVSVSLKKLDLDTFKNNLTQDINNDLIKYKLIEINYEGECPTLISTTTPVSNRLNRCINFVFEDPNDSSNTIQKAFGSSYIDNTKASVEDKFLYYDGIKYPLKDKLPSSLPDNRTWKDLQSIRITDDTILNSSISILEDGTKVTIYRMDIYIEHLDYDEDFGIHIVATTDVLPKMEPGI